MPLLKRIHFYRLLHLEILYLSGNNIQTFLWLKFLPKLTLYDFPCPKVNHSACEINCKKPGRLALIENRFVNESEFDESNCYYCDCQCGHLNCSKECVGHAFILKKMTNGCHKCECFCPRNDCDMFCEGEGFGILGPKDETGCSTTCAGCQNTTGMFNFHYDSLMLFPFNKYHLQGRESGTYS